MKKIRIWWLKRQLKSVYIKYREKCSNNDCGSYLTEYISGYKTRCNSIIEKLQSLGEPVNRIS